MSDTAKIIALAKAVMPEIDPAAVESAVSDWLDDHPEATTTVEDGSITKAKLDSNLQGAVDDVSGLKDEISNYEVATEEIVNGSASFNDSIYYGGYANNLFLFDIHKTKDYTVNKVKLYVLKSNIENPTYSFKLFSWYTSGTQILVREVSDAVDLEEPTESKELRTVVLENPFMVSAGDGIGIIATPYKWMGYNTNTTDIASPVLFRDGNYDTIDADYRIYTYIPTFSKQQPAVTMYSSGVELKDFLPKDDYAKIVAALNNENVVWELGNIGSDGIPSESTRYLRTKNYVYLPEGTNIWCGQYYTFAVYKYADDLSFVSNTEHGTECNIETTGFYKLTIYPADTFDSTAYIPNNNVISFSSVQRYERDICNSLNYINTQNTPIRISGTDAKMAHDSSIVFDGNDLWAAYYEDDTTYGEALTNLTTYIVIKKINPYTRQEISSQTFKVGDSIGNYTQTGRAPYIPKLVVYNDYILMYFLGWDSEEEEIEICSCRINKSTLELTNFTVCTLEDKVGAEHSMTCSGVSAVYKSYTNIDYIPNIIGITAQPQYYNNKWYSTLNSVFGDSPGMKTLLIESLNGIDWTVNRVLDEIGVAQECSFVIKDGYVYAATRAGCYLAKYSIDPEETGCVKIFQPLAIPLKTAMCIFKGKILLACNIKCERDSSISDNRKNMGIFEIDENLNVTLKTRIITEQGMHYPCFAIANDELWFAWSNDYRFLNRMTQRTNVSVSKIEV